MKLAPCPLDSRTEISAFVYESKTERNLCTNPEFYQEVTFLSVGANTSKSNELVKPANSFTINQVG